MSSEPMQDLVSEVKKNKFTAIQKLSEDDVISVWNNVSDFIQHQMSQQKGVHIRGLGTFSFSQKKVDIGNKKFIMIQRPVFILSEKFALTHGLESTKHYTTGEIPIVQLNYSSLASESPFHRDVVESCVREVLLALSRSVSSKRNVEFVFSGIGRLSIRDQKVKMKFYREFVECMDGSGRVANAMVNRPYTADSVMSDRCPSGPHTGNTLILPRISPSGGEGVSGGLGPEGTQTLAARGKPTMDAIDEEPSQDVSEDLQKELAQRIGGDEILKPVELEDEATAGTTEGTDEKRIDEIHVPGSPKGVKGLGVLSSNPTKLVPVKGGEYRPSSMPPIEGATMVTDYPVPPGSACGHVHHSGSGQELCYLCHQRSRRNIPVSFEEERRRKELEEDRLLQKYQHLKDTESILHEQDRQRGNRQMNQKTAAFNLGVADVIRARKGTRSEEFHRSYLFTHRPFTPPRHLKQERYSNDLGEQVTTMQHDRKRHQDDEEFLERLEQIQLAEDLAVQREKYLKEKADQCDQYQKALAAQILIRDSTPVLDPIDRPYTPTADRPSPTPSDPVPPNPSPTVPEESPPDAAEDIFAAANNKTPSAGCDIFKKRRKLGPLTLPKPQIIIPFNKSQPLRIEMVGRVVRVVKNKPTQLPPAQPNSADPIFGANDAVSSAKLAEKHRRAKELHKTQLEMVATKKRETILKHLIDQKEEERMLDRVRSELKEDRVSRYLRQYNSRKSLESSWLDERRLKNERESAEKLRAQTPGLLLHEQCDRYHRCDQCLRTMANYGGSNVWRETRYIPGSRLMV